ncbi:hypothetical protein CEXT_518021 [Caerostris extrusa]|uniref:Uncharacterized protein n=1 Tax=Caerostris extrusa TaxID=172846 RepID=A0AAV4SJ77_CAEEX|nr:hypothetical protein CEXT_518021 [Caerostris extrusa]
MGWFGRHGASRHHSALANKSFWMQKGEESLVDQSGRVSVFKHSVPTEAADGFAQGLGSHSHIRTIDKRPHAPTLFCGSTRQGLVFRGGTPGVLCAE